MKAVNTTRFRPISQNVRERPGAYVTSLRSQKLKATRSHLLTFLFHPPSPCSLLSVRSVLLHALATMLYVHLLLTVRLMLTAKQGLPRSMIARNMNTKVNGTLRVPAKLWPRSHTRL